MWIFIAVLDSFFHVVTAAATLWTTVISQRPAPVTLDRCDSYSLFLHAVHIGVVKTLYRCVFQCPPNLHKQDGYLCQVNQVCYWLF